MLFIIGFFIGGLFSFILAACLSISGREDERAEKELKERGRFDERA